MELPYGEPESWAKPYLERVRMALQRAGYLGAGSIFSQVHSAIAGGHISGMDYFYEYAIESYYEAAEEAENAKPLAVPRWELELLWLEEEAASLAEFEERLADSSTVLCAEPLLAPAIHGLVEPFRPVNWSLYGYSGQPGEKIVIVEKGKQRCRISLPGSLYALTVAGLNRLGAIPGNKSVQLVVADPAWVRRKVYTSHTPYEEVPSLLISLTSTAAKRAERMYVRDVCGEENVEGVLALEYSILGVSHVRVTYLC